MATIRAMQLDRQIIHVAQDDVRQIAANKKKQKRATKNLEDIQAALAILCAKNPDAATYTGEWPKWRVIEELVTSTDLSERTITRAIPKRRELGTAIS
jgi:hypothetical protein